LSCLLTVLFDVGAVGIDRPKLEAGIGIAVGGGLFDGGQLLVFKVTEKLL